MASAGKKRRVFSAEYKLEAVRRMAERRAAGISLEQIGRELDERLLVAVRTADECGSPPSGQPCILMGVH